MWGVRGYPDRLLFPKIIREKGGHRLSRWGRLYAASIKIVEEIAPGSDSHCVGSAQSISGYEVRLLIHRLKFGVLLPGILLSGWRQADAQAPGGPGNAKSSADYSGMYSFLREGEFVQITVEQQGRVTGFVSRYGDTESDRGVFLDHFFKQGRLDGNQLTFTTEVVHGLAHEFRGRVERGEGKNPGDEAYYVLRGILTENTVDDAKRTSSRSREVALRIFPRDLVPAQGVKK